MTINKQDFADLIDVREWLQKHHRKQLALLDRFLFELKRGRLAQTAGDSKQIKGNLFLFQDRRIVTHRTVDLLRHMIGSTHWKSPAQLLSMLRGLGRELEAAGGSREPAIGNVVRRIMAAVREEAAAAAVAANAGSTALATSSTAAPSGGGGRLSLESMLWALPQHVKPSSSRSVGGGHERQESFADADFESRYPALYYAERPDLKSAVMEASK